jgi:hypothetical protein
MTFLVLSSFLIGPYSESLVTRQQSSCKLSMPLLFARSYLSLTAHAIGCSLFWPSRNQPSFLQDLKAQLIPLLSAPVHLLSFLSTFCG